jgi:hypothetical protein
MSSANVNLHQSPFPAANIPSSRDRDAYSLQQSDCSHQLLSSHSHKQSYDVFPKAIQREILFFVPEQSSHSIADSTPCKLSPSGL